MRLPKPVRRWLWGSGVRLPSRVRRWLLRSCIHIVSSRPADFVIGESYLYRWWILPRNRWFNVYLHVIHDDDDDRALHDHPWWNVSMLLHGSYFEHLPRGRCVIRRPGDVVCRRAVAAHRLELRNGPCWSLFITGRKRRTWGFHCPRGWRPWYEFVDTNDPGRVGRGCD